MINTEFVFVVSHPGVVPSRDRSKDRGYVRYALSVPESVSYSGPTANLSANKLGIPWITHRGIWQTGTLAFTWNPFGTDINRTPSKLVKTVFLFFQRAR